MIDTVCHLFICIPNFQIRVLSMSVWFAKSVYTSALQYWSKAVGLEICGIDFVEELAYKLRNALKESIQWCWADKENL